MTATTPSRRLAIHALRLSIAVAFIPVCYVAWDQSTYNFGIVQPGHIYRSGQMPPQALARTIRDRQIKTVLNLRGSNRVDAWGSERTGLVSAFTELLRPDGTVAQARAQFSAAYLFVRLGDGKVMAEHLDQYESWLAAEKLSHSPTNFRRWVEHGFKPGLPNREQWPYDPYPLVVITRPGAAPEVIEDKKPIREARAHHE